MSKGLVSKWADDDDLVVKASKQDHVVAEVPSVPKAPPKSAAPPKKKKLESMWADSDDDEQPQEVPKKDDKQHRRHTGAERVAHRPERGAHRAERGTHRNRGSNQQLKTPPPSREKHQESDEERPAMSAAAKSFAERLGSGSKPRRPVQSPEESEEEIVEEEGEQSDDEPLPQMTSGNALAARLGMSVQQEPKKTRNAGPTRKSTSTREKSLPEARNSSSEPKTATPKGKYVPPKQKRLLEEQRKAEEAAKLKQQQEEEEKARYIKELDKMVKEMEDSKISWADMDD